MKAKTRILIFTAIASTLFLSGCVGIGPRTVKNDRIDYINAISESWKEQMLLNMVKIRYGDVPVFLDVSSVIAQYSIETQFDGQLGWGHEESANLASQSIGGSAKYTDRPTVTYSPMAGEKFTRSLMTPIRPAVVMGLIQAGYPIDLVLRFCVHSINGIRNDYGGPARAHVADKGYYRLIAALKRIQVAGALGFRALKASDGKDVILNFPLHFDEETAKDVEYVLHTLHLEPKTREYTVAYGLIPEGKKEIALLTRSVFDILVDASSHISVPQVHVEEKRVNPTPADPEGEGQIPLHLIRIQSSESRPEDVLVTVPYRKHWFSIDDRDPVSKRLFSFLMFILALTESGDRGVAPLVTIPAG